MKPIFWNALATPPRRLFVAAGFLVLLLLAQSHFRLAMVVGESMLPGLLTGDLLLVDKKAYCQSEPQRGDIVLAHYGKELIVKRVVGLPGEEVALTQGYLFVNGQALREPYAIQPGPLAIGPGGLFPGRYALLGDNRDLDVNQSVHAITTKEGIVGKVVWALHWRHPDNSLR